MKISDHMNSFSGVLPIIFLLMADLAASQSNPNSPNQPSGPYNYGKLSPAMLIIVAILIIALFVMGFFSIYLRRNPDVSPTTGVRSRSTVPAAARGLDASVVETFPTFLYSDVKTQKLGKGELECAICLNEFEDDETLRLIPKCDHVFHPHCIGAWLEAHVTCPVCRANLSEQDIELKEETANPEPVVNDPVSEQLANSETDSRRLPGVPVDLKRIEFSRSHTTGHSVIQPGESTERFTLRLPEDVRRRIIKDWKLNRINSSKPRARSDRWLFRKTPSFMWRSRDDGSIRLGGSGTSSVRANASNGGDRWSFLRNASFLVRNGSVHVSRGVNKDSEGVRSVSTSGGSVRLPV